MSALAMKPYRGVDPPMCATHGCVGSNGPRAGQYSVFVLGHPYGGTLERSYFCKGCAKELQETWDEALRERQEAERVWDSTLVEIAA